MPIETVVAFGGVALLGFAGFLTAWFSPREGRLPADSESSSKASEKEQLVATLAEVEKKLESVSSRIASL